MSSSVTGAVEGDIDEAVLDAIAGQTGFEVGVCHVTRGQARLLLQLPGFNNAARFSPWVVLTDLDGGDSGLCAPDLRSVATAKPCDAHVLPLGRTAGRSVAAFDAAALSTFLSVPPTAVPARPDGRMPQCKAKMVDLARRSRRRAIRDGMVPSPGSGRTVGPEYAGLMIEFAL